MMGLVSLCEEEETRAYFLSRVRTCGGGDHLHTRKRALTGAEHAGPPTADFQPPDCEI